MSTNFQIEAKMGVEPNPEEPAGSNTAGIRISAEGLIFRCCAGEVVAVSAAQITLATSNS